MSRERQRARMQRTAHAVYAARMTGNAHLYARATRCIVRAMAPLLCGMMLCVLVNCDRSGAPAAATSRTKPLVFAANAPLASFVRSLAGDAVVVSTPSTAHATDPADWLPTSTEIRSVAACDLIVLNGAGYEPWTEQAALPRARVLVSSESKRDRYIHESNAVHSHGPEGEHSHGATASTTWLSMELAQAQLDAIAARLTQLLPTQRAQIEEKRAVLNERLRAVSNSLKATSALRTNWFASHPVYQYLAQEGGLVIESMHWEPGEMPNDDEWEKFRALRIRDKNSVALMLWEGEPGSAIREKLAAISTNVVVFPPQGVAGEPDFVSTLEQSVAAMHDAAASTMR